MSINILEGGKFGRMVEAMELMALSSAGQVSSEQGWAATANIVKAGMGEKVYGIGSQMAVEKETSVSASIGESTGITAVTVDEETFLSAESIVGGGIHVFIYHAGVWTYNDTAVRLADYGITATGTPADGDEVIITESYNRLDMDVVAFHNAIKLSNPNKEVSAMWLQSHWALDGIQFDASEAIWTCVASALTAGTYHFGIGTNWGTHCVAGKVYQFTTPVDVPVKGQIVIGNGSNFYTWGAPDVAPSNWKAYIFESATSITPLAGPLDITEGSGGTDLGTMVSNASYSDTGDQLNSLQRAAYGYNRWSQSAMRQWLNSDKVAGEWWTPQNIYDRPPQQHASIAGHMHGLSGDFRAAIQKIKVTTALNTVTDSEIGASEDTWDYFFLPSSEQEYIVPQASGVEGEFWPYWKDRLSLSSPQKTGADFANTAHIRYAYNNHTSPQIVRLRSAHRGYANSVWLVYTAGYANSNVATSAYRPAPACVIC